MVHDVFFLDHDHPEGGGDGGEGRSKFNPWEAQFVVALTRYLLMQGYAPGGVGPAGGGAGSFSLEGLHT